MALATTQGLSQAQETCRVNAATPLDTCYRCLHAQQSCRFAILHVPSSHRAWLGGPLPG